MSAIILRRRKLGRGSALGISTFSNKGIKQVRHWADDFPEGQLFVFRWGCTANVPDGLTTVNSARSIHWCSNKKQGRLDMQAAGVPVPMTWAADYVFSDESPFGGGLVLGTDKFVLRPAHHAQGRHLWVGTDDEILAAIRENNVYDGYVSRLIDKVSEYRVFVCQNRAVWVARKTPGNPDDVAWNVARGGRFDNVRWNDWPLPVIKAALAAAKVSGTDFCGVDVMVDAAGSPYVLEVNSAPSQTSEYRQRTVAKAFDYIIDNGKAAFPDVEDGPRRTYKSYIHPAVRGSDG